MSAALRSTQTPRICIIRPPSLLDEELDLLEALRFAKGEPSLVIDATFEDDLDGGEASKADAKYVDVVARRLAMMREIRALSKLAGAVPMKHPTIAPPALPAQSAAVTRDSFITIPPSVGSLPLPAIAASPATPGASSPLDATLRLPRITQAFAGAITARSESSVGRLIWAVLLSATTVAFTWWLVLDEGVTSPPGAAKTVQAVGASTAAQEARALAASLGSPSVISTSTPTPSDRASSAPGGSSKPVITGPVHPSVIVNALHPVHNGKSKLAPKPAKSRAMSALETESTVETGFPAEDRVGGARR